MFGFDFRSPQRRATSSGSVSLNSPFVPSHVMAAIISIRNKWRKERKKKITTIIFKSITFRVHQKKKIATHNKYTNARNKYKKNEK